MASNATTQAGRQLQFTVFPSELGWMAIAGRGRKLAQVAFGHPSRQAALAALDTRVRTTAEEADWWPALVERLQDYARGICTDFSDIEVDLDHLTTFQRRVVRACRAIHYGATASYGQLAKASGSARAARAVGSTMAKNRCPLVVPCHRVTKAGGVTGNFSAPQGVRMKTRLLTLEQEADSAGRKSRGTTSRRPR